MTTTPAILINVFETDPTRQPELVAVLSEEHLKLQALSTERKLDSHLLDAGHKEWARRQLAFVSESVQAMANNTRRIYQIGQLQQFVVQP